jgi:hypothetical protein
MSVQIKRGSILVYRVFDVAEEVNLSKVEELVKTEVSQRLKFTRSTRQAVIMRNAPVALNLGGLTDFANPYSSGKTEAFAKIWDYGVITIQFQIPINPGTRWEELIQLAAKLEQDTLLDEAARFRAQEVVNLIKPALRDSHNWHEFEDYAVFLLEEIEGIKKSAELLEQVDIARLLVAETSVMLADRAKKSIMEGTYQYSDQDLTVIDWNSALVVEPSGSKDVPEVIEFALTHLMEMRYYDSLLDQKLTVIYDSIEESRSRFFSNRFTSLSRESSARYIEFSEFIERVDNSFKVVGDFYLARIFRAAGEKMRIPEWEENITRKINLFSNLSELLQGEVNVNRSLWLEITIVVLILFEIITTFTKITTG